jgi:hypothetical protein
VASTVGAVLEFGLLLRLLHLRLLSRYKAFALFLTCDLLRDLVLRYYETDLATQHYVHAWAISAPLLWVVVCAATLECYQRFYRAAVVPAEIRAMIMTVAVFAAVVVSLPVSVQLIDHLSYMANWADAVRTSNRFVLMACATLITTQRLYFHFARVQMSHNLRIHRNALSVYLCAEASLRFVSALVDQTIAMSANILCTGLFCAAMLMWLRGMRANGDTAPPAGQYSPEEVQRREQNYRENVTQTLDEYLRAGVQGVAKAVRRCVAAIG